MWQQKQYTGGEVLLGTEKLHRPALILLSILQIVIASVLLNRLSKIEDWSAVYAEDSHGYLLVADYFMGKDIAPDENALFRYRLINPVIPDIPAG